MMITIYSGSIGTTAIVQYERMGGWKDVGL